MARGKYTPESLAKSNENQAGIWRPEWQNKVDIRKEAAARLREWRVSRKGWPMLEAANQITDRGFHCSENTYRNWELGSVPPVEVLQILYKLGLDLNWYFAGQKPTLKK